MSSENTQSEWLTIEDVVDIFEIEANTQAKYRVNRTIPFYKVGRKILYKLSELEEWITTHKVGTKGLK